MNKMSTKEDTEEDTKTVEGDVVKEEENLTFFDVEIPDVLKGSVEDGAEGSPTDNWYKVKGWYNELSFYSKVFQFFVEEIKETESRYGWWIILLSTLTSFITMLTVDPFDLSEQDIVYYTWGKNLIISVLSILTTLIAAWVKKKGYVKRIQAIDKRIGRLEKFTGLLDYQFRLVPREKRQGYLEFITKMRDEHNELAIYSNIISPSEFTRTMYMITRYNAPLVNGSWPWYNTTTKIPREDFARNIIKSYESHYSCKAWCNSIFCCKDDSLKNNPLLLVSSPKDK